MLELNVTFLGHLDYNCITCIDWYIIFVSCQIQQSHWLSSFVEASILQLIRACQQRLWCHLYTTACRLKAIQNWTHLYMLSELNALRRGKCIRLNIKRHFISVYIYILQVIIIRGIPGSVWQKQWRKCSYTVILWWMKKEVCNYWAVYGYGYHLSGIDCNTH